MILILKMECQCIAQAVFRRRLQPQVTTAAMKTSLHNLQYQHNHHQYNLQRHHQHRLHQFANLSKKKNKMDLSKEHLLLLTDDEDNNCSANDCNITNDLYAEMDIDNNKSNNPEAVTMSDAKDVINVPEPTGKSTQIKTKGTKNKTTGKNQKIKTAQRMDQPWSLAYSRSLTERKDIYDCFQALKSMKNLEPMQQIKLMDLADLIFLAPAFNFSYDQLNNVCWKEAQQELEAQQWGEPYLRINERLRKHFTNNTCANLLLLHKKVKQRLCVAQKIDVGTYVFVSKIN